MQILIPKKNFKHSEIKLRQTKKHFYIEIIDQRILQYGTVALRFDLKLPISFLHDGMILCVASLKRGQKPSTTSY